MNGLYLTFMGPRYFGGENQRSPDAQRRIHAEINFLICGDARRSARPCNRSASKPERPLLHARADVGRCRTNSLRSRVPSHLDQDQDQCQSPFAQPTSQAGKHYSGGCALKPSAARKTAPTTTHPRHARCTYVALVLLGRYRSWAAPSAARMLYPCTSTIDI